MTPHFGVTFFLAKVSMSSSVAGSIAWASLGNAINNVLAFAIFAVLAHLLGPAEIGMVAFAVVFIDLGRVLVFGGFQELGVQSEKWDDEFMSTLFWSNIGLAVLISASISLVVAPSLTPLFGHEIVPILAVLSAMLVVDGARAVHVGKLRREFKYKALARRGAIANSIAGVVAIGMAFYGWGVWSLVFQRVSVAIITTSLTWLESRWIPKRVFRLTDLRARASFTVSVTLSRLTEVISTRLPDLLSGGLLGPAAVGYYRVGARAYDIAVQLALQPVQQVGLSHLSRQNSQGSRVDAIGALAGLAYFVIAPSAAFCAVAAPDLVRWIFGPQWIASGVVLQILSLPLAWGALTTIIGSALTAIGRPGLVFWVGLTGVVFTGGALLVFARWGVAGIAAAVAFGSLVTVPPLLWAARHHLGVRFADYLRWLMPPVVASFCATSLLLLLSVVLVDVAWNHVALRAGAFGVAYLAVLLVAFRGYVRMMTQMVRPRALA